MCAGVQVVGTAGSVVQEVTTLHTLLVRLQGWGEGGARAGRLVAVDVDVGARLGLENHDHIIGIDRLSDGFVVGGQAEGVVITFAPLGWVLKAIIVIGDSRAVAKETGVAWTLDPLVGAELDEADVVPNS